MATKKRLKIRDKQGNLVDFDISSASVTIDAEGKSLDMKLSELVGAIADSIKSVTYNGEPKTPDQAGNIVIRQEQPNWNESNSQHPSYIQGKPDSVVNEILYDQQTRMVKQSRNGSVENVFTIPDGGTTMAPDTEMSGTSENAVQNKVIKAYVDAVSQRIDELVSTGNVQGVIDTFNEIKAFLVDFSESDTLVAKLLLKQDKVVAGNGIVVAQDGKTVSVDAEVVQPVTADGTFAIRIGGNTYTINLNHTHPQYLTAQSLKAGSNVSISVNQQTGEVTINAAGGSGGTSYDDTDVRQLISNLSTALQTLRNSLAAVATSGSYNDLSNKPDLSGLANIGKIVNAKDNTTKRLWIGTQAEYDSLTTFESDVLYLIKATKNIAGITIDAGAPSQNSVQLTATISPAGADDVTLAWSISEDGANYSNDTTHFAIDSSGLLTIKEGTDNASVTVKCQDINEASGTASATLQLTGLSYQDYIIRFEDMGTKRIVLNAMGKTVPSEFTDIELLADQNSGSESRYKITYADAAAATRLELGNDSAAKKFNEFRYFTGMQKSSQTVIAGVGTFYFHDLGLEEITFPPSLTGWDSPLYNLRSLKRIDLRGTQITAHTGPLFRVSGTATYALDIIYLPNGLTTVGNIVHHNDTQIDVSPRFIVFGTGFTSAPGDNGTFNLVSSRKTQYKGLNCVFTSSTPPNAFVIPSYVKYTLQVYYPVAYEDAYKGSGSAVAEYITSSSVSGRLERPYESSYRVTTQGISPEPTLDNADFGEEYSCVVEGLTLNGKTGEDRVQMAGITGTVSDIGIFTYDSETGVLTIPVVTGEIKIINN